MILIFFAHAAGQFVSLPSNLPQSMVLLSHFLVRLSLALHNFGHMGGEIWAKSGGNNCEPTINFSVNSAVSGQERQNEAL